MKSDILIPAAAMLFFFSCASKEEQEVIDKSLLPDAAAKPVLPAARQDSGRPQAVTIQQGSQAAPAVINPQSARTNPNPQTGAATTASTASMAGEKLNPPHGQPGHRCDISVGAPLNSKPVQQPAAPVTASKAPVITSTPAAPQQTLPGMNPPHGQPGHRCDISVGAPLNSKPAPAASPAAVTPVQKDNSKNQ